MDEGGNYAKSDIPCSNAVRRVRVQNPQTLQVVGLLRILLLMQRSSSQWSSSGNSQRCIVTLLWQNGADEARQALYLRVKRGENSKFVTVVALPILSNRRGRSEFSWTLAREENFSVLCTSRTDLGAEHLNNGVERTP